VFAIAVLIALIALALRAAPREKSEDALVHGAGQIGLAAAVALFGMDYFTSYFYATGELMSALHPYGLEHLAYFAVAGIAVANFVFGALYMYSLGVFNEGGGSFTASMRYLGASISLIVAVVLIQDYVLTIVVSTLSGVDQLLSITNSYGIHWFWHFALGASLAMITWYITIRGRGESSQVTFTLLTVFLGLTVVLAIGLFTALARGVPPNPQLPTGEASTVGEALRHLLTATMKGMVALSGLEAMSNGIQFVKDEDAAFVRWGKRRLPRLRKIWHFYSGKSGIGRTVQTSFLFYGGLTTLFLSTFAIRFNVFDGTDGRSLVGNLAFIGFSQIPGGIPLYWAYQILAVMMLVTASMTAFQDIQSMAWRNVAIGELPEVVVFRNRKGTFTRPVTAAVLAAMVIQLLVRGETSVAVPFYGVGVFLPITAMGWAIRRHIAQTVHGPARAWGLLGASVATALGAIVFLGQIIGKWEEGGWLVLISLSLLILMAHAILISPIGYRDASAVHRIVRDKSRIEGPMGSIVEWQSLKTQEYRVVLLGSIARFWEWFGVRRPVRFEPPLPPGSYEDAVNAGHTATYLEAYLPPTDDTQQPTTPAPTGEPPPEPPAV